MSDLAKILSGAVRSAPHGETQLRPYEPSVRDNFAATLLNGMPSRAATDFVGGLLGSTGIRHNALSVADFVPYLGNAFGLQENAQDGNYKGAGLNILGLVPALGGVKKMISGAPESATIAPANKFINGAATGLNQRLIESQPELDDDVF